jgi:predicted  nucleic acid-binding Zn-ribbon protein
VLVRDTRKAEQSMNEERLVKLESNAEHLKNDVSDFKTTMEKICTRIEKRIDDLSAKIDRGIDDLNAKVDKLNEKVNKGIGDLNSKIDKGVDTLNGKIDKLRDDMWKTRIELLLIGAGLLAIIARQFKWL